MTFIKSNIIYTYLNWVISCLMCKTTFPDICKVVLYFFKWLFLIMLKSDQLSLLLLQSRACLLASHTFFQSHLDLHYITITTVGKLPILQFSFPFSDRGFPFLSHLFCPHSSLVPTPYQPQNYIHVRVMFTYSLQVNADTWKKKKIKGPINSLCWTIPHHH